MHPNLIEFSLDHALQEDPRFDEVGPAGIVAWYPKSHWSLKVYKKRPFTCNMCRLNMIQLPLPSEMVALEKSLDDELTPWEEKKEFPVEDVEVRLIFPHWRAGTLPLSERVMPFSRPPMKLPGSGSP